MLFENLSGEFLDFTKRDSLEFARSFQPQRKAANT
jgi:hypothetical protein